MMHLLGGHVCKAPVREYGKIEVSGIHSPPSKPVSFRIR